MKKWKTADLGFILMLICVHPGLSQDPKETEDWSHKPKVVIPGKKQDPPGDAIILFDGTGLSKWTADSAEAQWKVIGKSMTVVPGTGRCPVCKKSFKVTKNVSRVSNQQQLMLKIIGIRRLNSCL